MDKKLERIQQILSEKFGIAENIIKYNTNLIGDCNLSSLEIADLLAMLEKEFQINLPSDIQSDSVKNVSDLISLVEQYSDEL